MDESESDPKLPETEIPEDDQDDTLVEAEIDAVVFDSSAIAAFADIIRACTEALKPSEQSEIFNNAWPPADFRKVTMRIYRQIPSAIKKTLKALGEN